MTDFMLTNTEFELLLCIAEGMSGDEIADKMRVNTNTVVRYIGNLKFKLSAKTQAELVALAYHHGILIPMDNQVVA